MRASARQVPAWAVLMATGLALAMTSPALAENRGKAPTSILPERPAASGKDTARAAAPARAADPATETRHAVRPGETLGGIAGRAGVPRILIIEANGLTAPYGVRAGQILVIPRRRAHVTKPGETGFAIAMDYGVPWSTIAAANGLEPDARVPAGRSLIIPTITRAAAPPPPATAADRDEDEADLASAAVRGDGLRFAWPAPGRVRRTFVARTKGASSRESGQRPASAAAQTGPHDGIDIVGAKGDAARAAASGLVWYAGKEPNLYGNVVILDHGKGWFSAYAKLLRVTVRKGDAVRAGERVGLIGDTGSTPTTELHFEIRRKTVPVDPLKILPVRH